MRMINTQPSKICDVCFKPDQSVRDNLKYLQMKKKGIILVVDAQGCAIGAVTDGVMCSVDFSRLINEGDDIRGGGPRLGDCWPQTRARECFASMKQNGLSQLPIVDADGQVTGLILLSEVIRIEISIYRIELIRQEFNAVADVMRSGQLSMKKIAAEFERRFTVFPGAQHALAVTISTLALHLACTALGLGERVKYLQDFTCSTLWQCLVIGADDRVLVCINVEVTKYPLGDLNCKTISQIWTGYAA